MSERDAIIELATLLAETIRRMGAAYGSGTEWRRDIAQCVAIYQTLEERTP